MFYHGYDNYMKYAFPEDELRPLSCTPLTRDRNNPGHIELNDALGNYSLTLIDSLSTLAIMASGPTREGKANKALKNFQQGIESLVEQYGDGSKSSRGIGKRAAGFDLDSKVQVFETVIRGVGGLLSAHLFAIGELPISGYNPKDYMTKASFPESLISPNKFFYNGQLLRLAENLARRLLPAFLTPTGMPYPRVNLRHGVPFYLNSPLNQDAENGQCPITQSPSGEITETCSAGAGSLVLEFSTLSRLTGDQIFEQVAKRAFWAVWERRSSIGLVGSGIDAETGQWTTMYTGIGAGIDSFYEYAAKAGVLLSGASIPTGLPPMPADNFSISGLTQLVTGYQQTAEAFNEVWQASHASIKRHLYRGADYIHPHYIQGDLFTGASRAFWIDSLSAFYPGVLATSGNLDEAVETHLLYTAIWNRYSAIPERWSVSSGGVEGGLGWWGGRPEFIESTYYLYQVTKDPWYLHVGEMALRDIKRQCWAKCGWSGIQDVRNGERSDRMESFFLGETAKYLFLLFNPDHPLNRWDAPFVFTTEGHPLIIPRSPKSAATAPNLGVSGIRSDSQRDSSSDTCLTPPTMIPFSISATAARADIFHAAKLARLDTMPVRESLDSLLVEYSYDHPSITVSDIQSPTNHTHYPWTLPLHYIPYNGLSSKLTSRQTFDITFPALPNTILGPGILQRVGNGILVNSMSGLRLGMIQDVITFQDQDSSEVSVDHYRIQSINSIQLGKDERIFLTKDTANAAVSAQDPNFTRIRDPSILDLVIDVLPASSISSTSHQPLASNKTAPPQCSSPTSDSKRPITSPAAASLALRSPSASGVADEPASSVKAALSLLLQQFSLLLPSPSPSPPAVETPLLLREYIPAILPVGPGAAPLPDIEEVLPVDIHGRPQGTLVWDSIYVGGYGCERMDATIAKQHQVLVLKRGGGCGFSEKLQNIPAVAPEKGSLQLVVIVSFDNDGDGNGDNDYDTAGEDYPSSPLTIRPLLHEPQMTSSGLPRRHPLAMVMVGGGMKTWKLMERCVAVGVKRRYEVRAQGVLVGNLVIL